MVSSLNINLKHYKRKVNLKYHIHIFNIFSLAYVATLQLMVIFTFISRVLAFGTGMFFTVNGANFFLVNYGKKAKSMKQLKKG